MLENIELLTFGLFSSFKSAAISIKQVLLDLFEKRFVQADPEVARIMSGNVLKSLLTGLEEPNEFYDRIVDLLWMIEKLNSTVFFNEFWCALNDFSYLRLSGMNFILKNPRKFYSHLLEVKTHINVDCVCIALCKSLSDKETLVVRSTLDCVCMLFPLNFSQESFFNASQTKSLIRACLCCLLKKNFSLSRRVYHFMLTRQSKVTSANLPSSATSIQSAEELENENITPKLLDEETILLTTEAFQEMLYADCGNDLTLKLLPFRIMCHFMDRSDISNDFLKVSFIDFLKSTFQHYIQTKNEEYLAGTNRFFEVVDLELSWVSVFRMISTEGLLKHHDLILFALKYTKMIEQEAKSLYIPNLLLFNLLSANPNKEMIETVLSLCDLTKCFDVSLVKSELSVDKYEIITDQTAIYSNCVFSIMKISLKTNFLDDILRTLLDDCRVITADGFVDKLDLGPSLLSCKVRLFLIMHRFYAPEAHMSFVNSALGLFGRDKFICTAISVQFPREFELHYLENYSHGFYSIEEIINIWKLYPDCKMCLITCYLIDGLSISSTKEQPRRKIREWVFDANLNIKKVIESFLFQFSHEFSKPLSNLLKTNRRQIEYVLEKLRILIEHRPGDLKLLQYVDSKISLITFDNPLPDQDFKALFGFMLMVIKTSIIESNMKIHSEILKIFELCMRSFESFAEQIEIGEISLIYTQICKNMSQYQDYSMFINATNCLFVNSPTKLILTQNFDLLKRIADNHIRNEYTIGHFCLFLQTVALSNSSEESGNILRYILDLFLASDCLLSKESRFNLITSVSLSLCNGYWILSNRPFDIFEPFASWRSLEAFLVTSTNYMCFYFDTNPFINQRRRINLNPDQCQIILKQAFIDAQMELFYIVTCMYHIDPDFTCETIIKFYSMSISETVNNQEVSRFFSLLNILCNNDLVSHVKLTAAALNYCVYNKKSLGSSPVIVTETNSLEFINGLISDSTWHPTESAATQIFYSFRDYFDNSKGKHSVFGSKFVFYLILYFQKIESLEKRLWKEAQDLLIRILSTCLFKMSKIVSVSIKKLAKSLNSAFEDSFDMSDVESYLYFFNSKIIPKNNVFSDNDKASEFLAKHVNDLLVPLISANISIGWQSLDALSSIQHWSKFWRREIIVDAFTNSKEFFRNDHILIKKKLINIGWTQSGSGTESDKFIEWISSRLIIPLPSNVNFLFMNKEAEYVTKCEALHQISFILYSCPKSHFLGSLPLILEKITESFKFLERCNVHYEILLLVKVLCLRFELHDLHNLWPIIFSELYTLLASIPNPYVIDSTQTPELFLFIFKACQVLDLMFVLRDYEFQNYLGLFFSSDTTSGLFDKWAAMLPDDDKSSLSHDSISIEKSFFQKRRLYIVGPCTENMKFKDFFALMCRHSSDLGTNVYSDGIDYERIEQQILQEFFY